MNFILQLPSPSPVLLRSQPSLRPSVRDNLGQVGDFASVLHFFKVCYNHHIALQRDSPSFSSSSESCDWLSSGAKSVLIYWERGGRNKILNINQCTITFTRNGSDNAKSALTICYSASICLAPNSSLEGRRKLITIKSFHAFVTTTTLIQTFPTFFKAFVLLLDFNLVNGNQTGDLLKTTSRLSGCWPFTKITGVNFVKVTTHQWAQAFYFLSSF